MSLIFYKPSIEELAPLKAEATKNGQVSEAEWLQKMSDTIAGLIRNDPRRYRAYGPYWWTLKRILIDRGHTEFGDSLDAEWLEYVDYGNPVWNLLACWVYGEVAMDGGLMYSNHHVITFVPESEDDGEADDREYTLVDDEVESLAIG